jgi:4-amino-4-deoxy-L-arabinose transferase-like glycosyltransferase
LFLWIWVLTYLLFFSLAATKLPNYVLPACPPLAVLTGWFLSQWQRDELILGSGWRVLGYGCLGLIGLALATGLLITGGVVPLPFQLRAAVLPGMTRWAWLGSLPILGAASAWWCDRTGWRSGVIASLSAAALLLTGSLAIWGSGVVDAHKAARALVQQCLAGQTEREVRVASYCCYRPSLVFYCQREVARFNEEQDALDFLRLPLPVYLFVPAEAWEALQRRAPDSSHVLGRHWDLYQRGELLVVTNR